MLFLTRLTWPRLALLATALYPWIRKDRQLRSLKWVRITGSGSRFHRVQHCLPKSPPVGVQLPLKLFLLCFTGLGLWSPDCFQCLWAGDGKLLGWLLMKHTVVSTTLQEDFISLAPVPDEWNWWHGLEICLSSAQLETSEDYLYKSSILASAVSKAQLDSRCPADLDWICTFIPCICCHMHRPRPTVLLRNQV